MAMKFFLFNIIMTPTPSPPFDSVSMMQGECFYCTLDVYCTIFMCVCFVSTSVMGWVCTPPPLPRQAVWSSREINPNCYSLEVSIAPDWFLIPADHPQCVRLIRPHELAATILGSISSGRGRNSSRPLLSATEGDGESAELRSLTEWLNV